tara:strand:+ start:520 stop:690 length:171 start_codon:yes stop_codon:yes gene_type:complete
MSNRSKEAKYRLEIVSKDEEILGTITDILLRFEDDYVIDWHYDSSSESKTIKINKK